jgi:hypothetical protein
LSLHGFKFYAANVAEVSQRIFIAYGNRLNLLRRQNLSRRTQANAAQKRVRRNKILGITYAVLGGIDKKSCTLADKIRIKRLAPDNFPRKQITPILMPLDDPGTCARPQGTHK